MAITINLPKRAKEAKPAEALKKQPVTQEVKQPEATPESSINQKGLDNG